MSIKYVVNYGTRVHEFKKVFCTEQEARDFIKENVFAYSGYTPKSLEKVETLDASFEEIEPKYSWADPHLEKYGYMNRKDFYRHADFY